ncbi:MAG: YceI family protein [Deltaproteobacteria bacterium]|nr:YceI family protein [Deltaproteobacteria bacterium]MBW2588973.1 YceI family protein [Deltaproteobacteria bacterium]
MRITVFLFAIGVVVAGCKDPGAEVTAATVESPVDLKAEPTSGDGHTIAGDLTLHGVTKRISFPATIEATGSEVSATAEFSINRQDYGISYPGMRDDLIRDLVVIKLSLKLPSRS